MERWDDGMKRSSVGMKLDGCCAVYRWQGWPEVLVWGNGVNRQLENEKLDFSCFLSSTWFVILFYEWLGDDDPGKPLIHSTISHTSSKFSSDIS